MVGHIYVLWDHVAKIASDPMFLRNDAVAQRLFKTNVLDKGLAAEDFEIRRVADFDNESSLIQPYLGEGGSPGFVAVPLGKVDSHG